MREPVPDGRVVHTDKGIADAFWEHHKDLADPVKFDTANQFQGKAAFHTQVQNDVQSYEALSRQPAGQGFDDLNQEEFEVREIFDAVSSLGNGKAGVPGSRMVNELLRYGGFEAVQLIKLLLDFLWKWETKPEAYKKCYICSVYKSGDFLDTNNYRGLTMLHVVGKLYSKIINNRLIATLEKEGLLHNAQNGFRPNRNCSDHILSLSETLLGRMRQGNSTYVLQTDCYKAYDTVWRDGLFYKLWQTGIRGKMWRVLKEMYQGTLGTAMQNGQTSTRGFFKVELGLAQGDPLSPTLYLVFINSLIEEVANKCQGVSLGLAQQLVAQMFADDFTGLSETAEGVDAMIAVVIEYCDTWRIRMNPSKCSVLVVGAEFEECKQSNKTWQWGDASIPLVESTKYLGVMLNHNMNWDVHAEYVLKRAEKAASAIWGALSDSRINLRFRRLLLNSLVKPVMEHGCEIWEPTKAAAGKLQSFYSKLQRKMLHCPKTVSHSILGAELGCLRLVSCRAQLRAEAAKRVHCMSAVRLPKVVTGVDWGANGCRGRPRQLWVNRSKTNLQELNIADSVIADNALNKMAFKKVALRCAAGKDAAFMKAEAAKSSSVAKFLELDNVNSERKMQPYLDSSNWRGAELMFQCRASSLLLNGLTGKWSRKASRILPDGNLDEETAKECQCCVGKPVESLEHFLLECPLFDNVGAVSSDVGRLSFLRRLKLLVGDTIFVSWENFKDKRVRVLLGQAFWGKHVVEVHLLFQEFLAAAWNARKAFLENLVSVPCSVHSGRVANGQLATAHN